MDNYRKSRKKLAQLRKQLAQREQRLKELEEARRLREKTKRIILRLLSVIASGAIVYFTLF